MRVLEYALVFDQVKNKFVLEYRPSIWDIVKGRLPPSLFEYTLAVLWDAINAGALVFRPEQIFDHPAQPIIGSFNPCFGWDYPPASYISVVLCGVNVYLTWRYTYTTTACCLSPARPTAPPHHE